MTVLEVLISTFSWNNKFLISGGEVILWLASLIENVIVSCLRTTTQRIEAAVNLLRSILPLGWKQCYCSL